VVDYQAGNLRSVETALLYLGADFFVSSDPGELNEAERLIFPGVGEARATMAVLDSTGLGEALVSFYRTGKPMLGICIGCQIILNGSEERDAACLGLVRGRALRFPENPELKVPHMGWNQVRIKKKHHVFDGVPEASNFYFVHSYYPEPEDKSVELAQTDYGLAFTSVIGQENLVAVQFHPEKSGRVGLKFLSNFLNWKR
jgi:glutamine amidotransferase